MPRFYLRGFTNDRNQLTRLPLASKKPHLVSVNDATVQKDFYTVDRDGIRPDAFEKVLAKIEAEAARVLKAVLEDGLWPLEDRDRFDLATWIALQFLRGEGQRNSSAEMYRSIAKLEVGVSTSAQFRKRMRLAGDVSDEEVESMRAAMLATADSFKVDHHQHLKIIADSLEGMTRLIYFRKPWMLIRFGRRRLATSDSPLILAPASDPAMGVGLGTASELRIPLSRKVGLFMGQLGGDDDDFAGYPATKFADAINNGVLHGANSAVFYHPDDAPFTDTDIPDPRYSDVDIPHRQINALIAAHVRSQGRGLQGSSPADGA